MSRVLVVRLLLIAVTLAAYWQVSGFGFVDFDDPEYVRDNNAVTHGITPEGVAWAFTATHVANWHPMTWLSLMLDAEAHRRLSPLMPYLFTADDKGLYPGAYHLTNVVIHAINVLLLFGLLRSMTGAVWRSAFVAGLLALHPVHVESVAWISERKDVLSMFFLLVTIWAYHRYVQDKDVRSYVFVLLFFALGLMTKPMLVTLPFALLLLDVWPLRRMALGGAASARAPARPGSIGDRPSWWWLIIEKLPLIALAALSSYITIKVQHGNGELTDGVWMPLALRLANSAVGYVQYIGTMFWPCHLAALYPNPSLIGQPFWSSMQVAGAAAALALITICVTLQLRKRPYLTVGWFWYLGTMLPVIGIVQIGRHSMADRYAYVPLIGLYIMIAWGVADLTVRWKHRTWPLGVAAAAVLAACASVTQLQLTHWRHSIALFEHTLAVTKDNWLIHNNLAAVLDRQGRHDEAIEQMEKALTIYPQCAWMHDHLGAIYSGQTKLYDAQVEFQKAIKYDPTFAKAYFNLGMVLSNRGQSAQAEMQFRRAVELKPGDVESRRALALVLAAQGHHAEAIAQLEEAKALRPQRAAEFDQLIEQFRSSR